MKAECEKVFSELERLKSEVVWRRAQREQARPSLRIYGTYKTYIRTYTHIYTYIHIYIHVYIHIYTYIYIHTYIWFVYIRNTHISSPARQAEGELLETIEHREEADVALAAAVHPLTP